MKLFKLALRKRIIYSLIIFIVLSTSIYLILNGAGADVEPEYPVVGPNGEYADFDYFFRDLKKTAKSLSFYRDPDRAILETKSGQEFLESIGVNYQLTQVNHDLIMNLIARQGIKNVRIGFDWGMLNWNETDLYNSTISNRMKTTIAAACQNGVKPLIILNANEGKPTPWQQSFVDVLAGDQIGSTTLTLNSTAGLTEGYSGISNQNGLARMAALLFKKIDFTANTVELARPLTKNLKDEKTGQAGLQVKVETFKYLPFFPEGAPERAATLAGWAKYVDFSANFVKNSCGSDNFELEVWNELTFGSAFLDINNWYEPDLTARPQNVYRDLLTISSLRAKSFSPNIKVVNGFSNTMPFDPKNLNDLAIEAQSHHPYGTGRDDVPADFPKGERVNWFNEGFPPPLVYTKARPEGNFAWGPMHEDVYDAHLWLPKRAFYKPQAVANFDYYLTEHGQAVHEILPHPRDNDQSMQLKAKAVSRVFPFMNNKGIKKTYWFNLYNKINAVGEEDKGSGLLFAQSAAHPNPSQYSQYPESAYLSPPLATLKNITDQFAGAEDLIQPNQLGVEVTSIGAYQPEEFAGDAAHPPKYYRDQFTFLPFQVSQNRYVAAVYLKTNDLVNPPGPMTFRVKVKNLAGTGAAVKLVDSLSGQNEPITINSQTATDLTVTFQATDYTKLLVIDTDPSLVDTSPPTAPQVYDATDTNSLINYFDSSDIGYASKATDRLIAFWTANEPESKISEYQYQIVKDLPSGPTVLDWQNSLFKNDGRFSGTTIRGLNLSPGLYFVKVKAKNSFGLWSGEGLSDGILIDREKPNIQSLKLQDNKTGNDQYTDKTLVNLKISQTDNSLISRANSAYIMAKNLETDSTTKIRFSPNPSLVLLAGDGLKNYQITLMDGAGNFSDPANVSIALETQAPQPPLVNDQGTATADKTQLSADLLVNPLPPSGLKDYLWEIRQDSTTGPVIASGVETSSQIKASGLNLQDDTAYYFAVSVESNLGLKSAAGFSDGITINPTAPPTADTTAPTAPANLTGSVTDQDVSLSWSASTDDKAVVGYKVYRDGSLIANATNTNWTDTALTPGSYNYTVKAYDGAGNLSTDSNTVSVTIAPPADITPPSDPLNLTASYDGTQVNLVWDASTDEVGVTGYRVYRNGAELNTVITNAAVDQNVTAGQTYAYTVKATDLAGNVSNQSAAAIITIPTADEVTPPSGDDDVGGADGTDNGADTTSPPTDDTSPPATDDTADTALPPTDEPPPPTDEPTDPGDDGTDTVDNAPTTPANPPAYPPNSNRPTTKKPKSVNRTTVKADNSILSQTVQSLVLQPTPETEEKILPLTKFKLFVAKDDQANQIKLSWLDPKVKASKYRLYKNGEKLLETNRLNHQDQLMPGTTNEFFVNGYDNQDKLFAQTQILQVILAGKVKIDKLLVKEKAKDQVTLTLTTNVPSMVEVNYRKRSFWQATKDLIIPIFKRNYQPKVKLTESQTFVEPDTSHTIILKDLKKRGTYYYQIKATNANDEVNKALTEIKRFKTK